MKRKFLLVALCGLLSACSFALPVEMKTEKGEAFSGELSGSAFGQMIHVVSKEGVECSGDFPTGMATVKIVDINCTDGRKGKVTVTINRDALRGGSGNGFLSDGTQFFWVSGDHIQNNTQGKL